MTSSITELDLLADGIVIDQGACIQSEMKPEEKEKECSSILEDAPNLRLTRRPNLIHGRSRDVRFTTFVQR